LTSLPHLDAFFTQEARMNDVLRTILATQKVITADGIERPLHSNIGDAQGEFL
jgi:hypothetical protein